MFHDLVHVIWGMGGGGGEEGREPIRHVYIEHQVLNPDSNLDHNLHGRGGLSLDLNPVCLRVNANQSGSGSGSEYQCKWGNKLLLAKLQLR